jgi:hypothetical protein
MGLLSVEQKCRHSKYLYTAIYQHCFPVFFFFLLTNSLELTNMSYLSAEKAESELAQSIRKACSIEESAPKQKHVRSKYNLEIHPGKNNLQETCN